MKKKLLASLLAVCLFVGMAVPAFAEASVNPAPAGSATATVRSVPGDNLDVNPLGSVQAIVSYGDSIKTSDLTSLKVSLFRGETELSTNVLAFDRIDAATKEFTEICCPFNLGSKGLDKWSWNRGAYPIKDTVSIENLPNKVKIVYVKAGITYVSESSVTLTDIPKPYEAPVIPVTPPTPSTGGGSYNPPAASPAPVAPPVVTESAGKTDVVAAPVISEIMTTNEKTFAKAEIQVDTAITDKATATKPVQIKAELPTADVKSAIENSLTKQVEIKLTVPNAVATNKNVSITNIKADKSIFEQAKASGKEIVLKVETADGKLLASWSFDGAKIANTAVDVNLAVNLVKATTLPAINTAGAGVATKPLVVEFNHSGNLPASAKVTLDVSADYNNGEELFLYYFNATAKKLELISKGNKVVDGKVTIAISHCSDYVLTKNAVKVTTTTKVTTVPNGTKSVPKTGDTTPVSSVLILAVMAGALVIARKKLCK